MKIIWEADAEKKFNMIIEALPQFHRTIAKQLVKEKAQELAQGRGAQIVEEEDMVRAFFQEVPPAFKDMMKRLFGQLDIDYAPFIENETSGTENKR